MRIVADIGANPFQGFIISYDVIIEAGLPSEIRIDGEADAFGTQGFELVDDRSQRIGFPCLCRDAPVVGRDAPCLLAAYEIYCLGRQAPRRLYGVDNNDAVQVIGHDNPFVQLGIGADLRGFSPFVGDNCADGGQMHFAIPNITKIWDAPVGDDGNEIITGAGIIPTRQAGGGYAVFTPEAVHRY